MPVWLGWRANSVYTKVGQIVSPSSKFLLTDSPMPWCKDHTDYNSNSYFTRFLSNSGNARSAGISILPERHEKGFEALMGDNHVEFRTKASVTTADVTYK